jgi:peptidoglycan/LPS O-acetylase OafA/YrhL
MLDLITLILALAGIVFLAVAVLAAIVSTHRVDTPITHQPPRRNPSFDLTAEDKEAKP